MKYAILAAAFTATVSFGLSAQAEPRLPDTLKVEAGTSSSVQKVDWHNRWRSHHRWGSGRGWHNRWRSHHRWGSRY
jgi:hypothetical protein